MATSAKLQLLLSMQPPQQHVLPCTVPASALVIAQVAATLLWPGGMCSATYVPSIQLCLLRQLQ